MMTIKVADLVQHLKDISEGYFKLEEMHRSTSFHNAATNISEAVKIEEVESLDNILQLKIRGVGDSTIQVLKEFVSTGKSQRLVDIQEKVNSRPVDNNKLSAAMEALALLRQKK